jgi:hypothetical protein
MATALLILRNFGCGRQTGNSGHHAYAEGAVRSYRRGCESALQTAQSSSVCINGQYLLQDDLGRPDPRLHSSVREKRTKETTSSKRHLSF